MACTSGAARESAESSSAMLACAMSAEGMTAVVPPAMIECNEVLLGLALDVVSVLECSLAWLCMCNVM